MQIAAITLIIFTILFLMLNIENRIILILISIFILPFFYGYFAILPNAVKLIYDIYLFLFLVEIILKSKFQEVIYYTKLTKYTSIYILAFTIVFILSYVVNEGNILLSMLEYRKIIFPLLFLFVLNYYSILKNRIFNFEPFLKIIFAIQFILIPLQYIFYNYFKEYIVELTARYDCATGTFGRGTTMVGVFIISYFMYRYILNKHNLLSFFILTPLAFVFSGGGNLLLVSSFSLNQILSSKRLKTILKTVTGIIVFGFLVVIVSSRLMDENIIVHSYEKITRGFTKSRKNIVLIQADNKLSRYYGHVYAANMLNNYDKQLVGFGNDVYAASASLDIRKNKFKLNEVLNLVPELMLKYGYPGLIINLLFYGWLIFYFYRKRRLNIYYHISFILAVINLANFMYTKPIYQPVFLSFIYFIFYKAEIINKRGVNENSISSNTHL